MGWWKKHPLFSAVVIFLLITLPSTIDSYWDLWQKFTEARMPLLDFGFWWRVLSPIVGLIIAGIILWQLQPNKPTRKNGLLVPATPSANSSALSNKSINKAPIRLIHDNVLWEDGGTYLGGGIVVNGPFCPKDYAVLMMEQGDNIYELKYDKSISISDYHYLLYCPECKNKYILGDRAKTAQNSLDEVRNRFEGKRRREPDS